MHDFEKNYILDFGNVLYEIDQMATYLAFLDYAARESILRNLDFKEVLDYQIFKDYETGVLSSDEFRKKMRNDFLLRCSDKEFDAAWNNTLVGLFDYSINSVKKIKKNGTILLLSNTNKIHFDYFYKECKELFEIFDKCFFSFELGMRKPNTDIYENVLIDAGLDPMKTVFFDDSAENLRGAELVGIETVQIDQNLTLSGFLHSVSNNTQQKP
jgi:glucose-1-phosphatase